MGEARTQLSPVQEGDFWRVRIAWPNGAVHFVGKFPSEKDAIAWINGHSNLTKPVDTVDAPPLAGDFAMPAMSHSLLGAKARKPKTNSVRSLR
jgi:hypothetical protein